MPNPNSKPPRGASPRTSKFQRYLDQLTAEAAAELIAAERTYVRETLARDSEVEAAERDFRESFFGYEDRAPCRLEWELVL